MPVLLRRGARLLLRRGLLLRNNNYMVMIWGTPSLLLLLPKR
jgi:hypothetical protein